ncbi:hypothetical protein KAU88_02660 [Candidatus Bathyarchaeota archaeon]|nr:hypothetical protein [Candidatus Bathyarchaeota archaeon]
MSVQKEDPIKLHKQGNILYETEKYEEAAEKFLQSSELYEKKGNFFDASNMLFKAGECSFMLKKYKTAIERFNKSADISFQKGFDRFGVSALEYILDCYKGLKKEKSKEAVKLQKKIKEVKDKLASQLF